MSGNVHESLKPLTWLIGHWRSISAKGSYPTIQPFTFCDETKFESVGQPILNYISRTWHPEKGIPMHLQRGFLRINPGTNSVAFMVAHNLGINSLEEGTAVDETLNCKSTQISSMTFVRDPAVCGIERKLRLLENGNLEAVVFMETSKTPMTQHLKIVYEKI